MPCMGHPRPGCPCAASCLVCSGVRHSPAMCRSLAVCCCPVMCRCPIMCRCPAPAVSAALVWLSCSLLHQPPARPSNSCPGRQALQLKQTDPSCMDVVYAARLKPQACMLTARRHHTTVMLAPARFRAGACQRAGILAGLLQDIHAQDAQLRPSGTRERMCSTSSSNRSACPPSVPRFSRDEGQVQASACQFGSCQG